MTPTSRATEEEEPATSTPEGGPAGTPEPTPTPAATRAAGPPPDLSGTLFFPVFEPEAQTYNIYALDLKSGEMAVFIEEGSQPAITPDGERIAWRSWRQDKRGLLSRPMDGTDIWTMISFHEAARPDWGPGGEQFVFPAQLEPDRQSRLYLFTGVGDEPFIELRRHGSPIIGRVPAFVPESGGARIVYQGCVENACGLMLMDVEGGNPEFLQNTFPDDTAPAVSPVDSSQIVYMSESSGYWQVKIANTDGTGQRPLTDDWYWNGLPTWSPDGAHIIFVSTRDENWPDQFELVENAALPFRLWVMEADGENQRPLNEFRFRLDGVPARVPDYQAGGWIEERMVWIAGSVPSE
jgi:Tol biopolymer transport system component